MKPRNLLIAAVCLAALSGLVWYAKQHPPSSAGSAAAATPKVLEIPERDIDSIDVRKKNGGSFTLEQANGVWSITAPEQWKTDKEAVTGLVSALNPVAADNVVEDAAGDLTKYGLNAPSLEVTVHRKNGKADEVLFGDDVPAGSLVYARSSTNPRVYAVASSVKTAFDKSPSDLRDKRLLTFDANKLTRLDLVSGKNDIEFGKNNSNEWQILKPQPYRADSFGIEELLRKLGEAKMDLSGSPNDAAKSASAFAAAKPLSTVKAADSSGVQTLELRKVKDDYYAKSSVVPGVFKVSADLGKAVDKPVDDFRNKKLFDFGFSDPTSLTIQSPAENKSFTRSGTDWKSGGKTMDAGAVQAFVDKLRDLSASKFETAGFTSPAFTVSVVSNDGKRSEKVEFAKSGSTYLGRRSDAPTLYQVDSKTVNDMLEASKAIKPASSSTAKK